MTETKLLSLLLESYQDDFDLAKVITEVIRRSGAVGGKAQRIIDSYLKVITNPDIDMGNVRQIVVNMLAEKPKQRLRSPESLSSTIATRDLMAKKLRESRICRLSRLLV